MSPFIVDAGPPWTVEHGMVVRHIRASHATRPRSSIVWIHGLGEWSISFNAIARHPRFAEFEHVLPDLPGYGRTPSTPAGTVASIADTLIDWLRTRPPVFLIGHSMGGVLATMVAEQIAVRGVVNIDGNLTLGDCTFSAQAAGYARSEFRARGFATMRDDVYARGASEPALRGYYAAMLAADADTFHANATDLVALSTVDDLAPRFAKLAAPGLFVAGVPGGICKASRDRLDEVGARWVGIDSSGHWPYVDQPDAFATAVGDFLDAI